MTHLSFSIQNITFDKLAPTLEEWSKYDSFEEKIEAVRSLIEIAVAIERSAPSHSRKYYACMRGEIIEGVMVLQEELAKKALCITVLITHPKNLTALPARVSGVGTALIHRAMDLCLERGRDRIELNSTWDSRGFYEKMGFERGPCVFLTQTYFMTAGKIAALLSRDLAA